MPAQLDALRLSSSIQRRLVDLALDLSEPQKLDTICRAAGSRQMVVGQWLGRRCRAFGIIT